MVGSFICSELFLILIDQRLFIMSGCGQVMKEVLEPTLKSSLPCTERKEKQRKFKSGMQRTILSRDNWTSLRYCVCGLFILYNIRHYRYPFVLLIGIHTVDLPITLPAVPCLACYTRKIVTSLLISS